MSYKHERSNNIAHRNGIQAKSWATIEDISGQRLAKLYRFWPSNSIHRVTSPKSQALGGGGSSLLTNVGASLLFFGTKSSFSDSLVSRFPRTLPLTELGRLLIIPNGVCGGVVHGRPLKDELGAVTLGTFPNVGVGLFPTICDD
jgi:hypothetical protein